MSASLPEAEVRVDADAEAAGARLAADAVEWLTARMRDAPTVHLAVSGGSLATRVLPALVQHGNAASLDWQRLHVWFADERFVPRGAADRNASAVLQAMRQAREFPSTQVHIPAPSDADRSLEDAAADYERELRRIAGAGRCGTPSLDLVLLGMGPDGHTASLFPAMLPAESEALVVPVRSSPKPPPERVSLTFTLLDAARCCWLYATGAEKREALARARSGTASASEVPAGRIRATHEVRVYADGAAAGGEG